MSSVRPEGHRVVLVDDEHELLKLGERVLQHAGFVVWTASSPIGVGALIKRHAPDVLVLDVTMPGLDGAALAKLLERGGGTLPVVFWSALPEAELQRLTRTVARSTYVAKGAPIASLVATVERMIRLHAKSVPPTA